MIFPVMRELLAEEPAIAVREPVPPPPVAAKKPVVSPSPVPAIEAERPVVAPAPAPVEARPASRPAPAPATMLDRANAALRASEAWRVATHEETIAGERVVAIGDWAQLTARSGRCQVVFADDPAPPAYDVARLMRFLADHDIPVDVLPTSAFRRR